MIEQNERKEMVSFTISIREGFMFFQIFEKQQKLNTSYIYATFFLSFRWYRPVSSKLTNYIAYTSQSGVGTTEGVFEETGLNHENNITDRDRFTLI